MSTDKKFHSGMITIIGLPNVGKSTLMNYFLGEKISITSSKPQTTRSRLMGIVTHDNHQLIFLDTPGVHKPRTKLGEYMMKSVRDAMEGTDAILMMVDVTHCTDKDTEIAEKLRQNKKIPIVLAVNKIDMAQPEGVLSTIARFSSYDFSGIVPVSAETGEGMEDLLQCLESQLPEGPLYFPEDMITDQPERVLCAEMIREKALAHLRDEVPHGIGVEIVRIEKVREDLTEINATIYCEREAHKGMIIGKQGTMLRTIGSEARNDIEKLMDTHVLLKLWVKTKPDWRNSSAELKNLGYE